MGDEQMISPGTLDAWEEIARRDDWHMRLVGSDIRMLISDLRRARHRLAALEANASTVPEREAGWRCFHCGEMFTDERCARLHFGRDEESEAACRIKAGAEQGLLGALREAEYAAADARHAIADESTDAAKAYYAQATRHAQSLRNAEEAGYERGVEDGLALQPRQHDAVEELKPTMRVVTGGHFGPFVVVDGVPAHTAIIVGYHDMQVKPKHVRLPNQAYVADLLAMLDENCSNEAYIIPTRSAERLSITREQLEAALKAIPAREDRRDG